jgi:phospholipid N-methyltransferase
MPPPAANQSQRLSAPLSLNKRFTPSGFIRQVLQRPQTTGAIAPSSRAVADTITDLIDFDTASTIVELGPGTGVFTEHLVPRLANETTFFALEINPAFAKATRIRCPQARVYTDSATRLQHYLRANDVDHAQYIVCSLPWTIFDKHEQLELLKIVIDSLPPGGEFISIVYLGSQLRSRGRYFTRTLPQLFSTVERHGPVWCNLPPTQVYRCIK